MNYQELTKEGLIEIIKDYQLLTFQLVTEVDRDAGFDVSSNGNLGHWYLNLKTDTLTGNPMRLRAFGYTEKEILQGVSIQDFLRRVHPDDVHGILSNLSALRKGDTNKYAAEYRIRGGERGYKRFSDRGRITQYDDNGRPLFLTGFTNEISSGMKNAAKNRCDNTDLQGQAFLDNLTKTKNRRSLIMDLSTAVMCAEQSGSSFILALLSIDDFKTLNETKGQLCGNKVLIDIAGLIRQNIGEKSTFGRYNTDEFMIIFSKTKKEDVISVLEKIRRSVERHQFPDQVKITVSGGMKEFQGEDLSELVKAVEIKLSQAKTCGQNKIEI
jgi:diguanylate cyclase (GGDEF)-like protein